MANSQIVATSAEQAVFSSGPTAAAGACGNLGQPSRRVHSFGTENSRAERAAPAISPTGPGIAALFAPRSGGMQNQPKVAHLNSRLHQGAQIRAMQAFHRNAGLLPFQKRQPYRAAQGRKRYWGHFRPLIQQRKAGEETAQIHKRAVFARSEVMPETPPFTMS